MYYYDLGQSMALVSGAESAEGVRESKIGARPRWGHIRRQRKDRMKHTSRPKAAPRRITSALQSSSTYLAEPRRRSRTIGAAGPGVKSDGADSNTDVAHGRAYGTLKEAVLAGGFRPGEVVTIRGLAKRFSLGHMPVREALRSLISEGAFEALPNRSARIPTLTRRQIEQILDLRVQLESRAAGLAARNITLVQIEHLHALENGMQQCLLKGDADGVASLNMAFHFEIYRIADNPVLFQLIQTLWLRMASWVSITVRLLMSKPRAVQKLAYEHHLQLLHAFQVRSEAAAADAMEEQRRLELRRGSSVALLHLIEDALVQPRIDPRPQHIAIFNEAPHQGVAPQIEIDRVDGARTRRQRRLPHQRADAFAATRAQE